MLRVALTAALGLVLVSCVGDTPVVVTDSGSPDSSTPGDASATDATPTDATTGGDASDAGVDACGNACGGCGNMCGDNKHFCVNGACAKFIFVTDSSFNGSLGGVAGAGAKCQTEAQGALPGQYVPWLGDSTDPNGVGDATLRMPKPWPMVPFVLADGTLVANDYASIVAVRNQSGTLKHAIDMSQTKVKVIDLVWTGDGQSTALCKDNAQAAWNDPGASNYGMTGDPTRTDNTLANAGFSVSFNQVSCSGSARLYCLEK